jgi:ATP-dependent DNA ligase
VDLFDHVCRDDCEGIVAKWARGRYHADGVQTSWLKIKNPNYSQMTGRREVFERRRDQAGRAVVDRFRLSARNSHPSLEFWVSSTVTSNLQFDGFAGRVAIKNDPLQSKGGPSHFY